MYVGLKASHMPPYQCATISFTSKQLGNKCSTISFTSSLMIATGENRTALYGTTGIEVQAIGHHPISFDVYTPVLVHFIS